jgi:ABC-type uncharacterized transport system substrate-binding protein
LDSKRPLGALPWLQSMKRTLLLVWAIASVVAVSSSGAEAHPHVWVTVQSDLVYAPDGALTAVRHHWTFDEMFSTFSTQGLDTNNDGKLSREELQGLAEVNVSSLKEFAYFTHARADGKKIPLADPKDYWLEHKDGALTLNFTLPLQTPLKAKSVQIDVFDGTYFVDFSMAKGEAVSLVSAPAQCKLAVTKAGEETPTSAQPLNESYFNNLDPNANFGARFANKIAVNCP